MDKRINMTEAAYMCGVTTATIYKWMDTRAFPQRDERRLFLESEIEEWAKANAVRTVRKEQG